MRDLINKYYVFTLVFIVLSIALFTFKDNKDLVNMIIGGYLGLITAPILIKE